MGGQSSCPQSFFLTPLLTKQAAFFHAAHWEKPLDGFGALYGRLLGGMGQNYVRGHKLYGQSQDRAQSYDGSI